MGGRLAPGWGGKGRILLAGGVGRPACQRCGAVSSSTGSFGRGGDSCGGQFNVFMYSLVSSGSGTGPPGSGGAGLAAATLPGSAFWISFGVPSNIARVLRPSGDNFIISSGGKPTQAVFLHSWAASLSP